MCCGRIHRLTRERFRMPGVIAAQAAMNKSCPKCGTAMVFKRGCCGRKAMWLCPNRTCKYREVKT